MAGGGLPGRVPAAEHDWRRRKQVALRDADHAFRLSFALVMEMQSVCRRHGVDFLVASFPSGLTYEARSPLPERFLEALKEAGVRVVDMSEGFRARGLGPASARPRLRGAPQPARARGRL
jgi:hypothetical protein